MSAGNAARAVLVVCMVAIASMAGAAVASTVSGRVLYQSNGRPIPGLTVYIVHPVAGRTTPAPTDSNGLYWISNVPPRRDPYYLEIYWGRTLKFRRSVIVTQPQVALPDIVL